MKDEGIGVYAIDELEKMKLPSDVTLLDAGTDIFKIMACEKEVSTLIILDAIQKKSTPGTIHRIAIDDIDTEPSHSHLHQIPLLEALRLMKYSCLAFKNSNMILIGIEPEKIEFGIGLTPVILDRMNKLIESVQAEIKNARSFVSEKYN